LQQQYPQEFAAMQAAYAAWAKANGVLAMPDGYNPVKQVLINSFVNYWIPAYRNTAIAVLAGLAGLIVAVLTIRRRRRGSGS
jgi:arylsulfatase/uncharacterized sulfatase